MRTGLKPCKVANTASKAYKVLSKSYFEVSLDKLEAV
jgi:hypothetical protein